MCIRDRTGHEVLPHPAFPRAVDRPHSPAPRGLATGPSDPRGSSTRRSWPLQSHTRLEAVRYDGCAVHADHRYYALLRLPLGAPPVPGCAYRHRRYRQPQDGALRPRIPVPRRISCSMLDCVIVPLPLRRRVSGAAHPRSTHRPWPSPQGSGLRARHPHGSPLTRGFVTTRIQDPLVRTDHLLAAQGDFVMALRQSGLPFRRPSATGPLGRYPDRTPTGKPTTASRTHTTELTNPTT